MGFVVPLMVDDDMSAVVGDDELMVERDLLDAAWLVVCCADDELVDDSISLLVTSWVLLDVVSSVSVEVKTSVVVSEVAEMVSASSEIVGTAVT